MIEIKEKLKCSGCHACYNICKNNAITMKEDEKGFKYPIIDREKCVDCKLCEKVCPILNNKTIRNEPKAYACYNKDEKIRLESSSGGMFSLIAAEILKRNGVVFGASFNNEFMVEHTFIEDMEELYKFRGSKYVQSTIGNTYKKVKEKLNENRYVLFTGTPCQVEGLLTYLGKSYDKLYTQDIICHGVPSPKVWRKYLQYRNKNDGEKPVDINFRNKDNGWKLFNLKFKYKNKEYKKDQTKDKFMQSFLRNVCLRDSCYDCKFKKMNRLSDITLADFWGIQSVRPELYDNKGTSLVIINSEKGKELFESIEKEIIKEEVDINEAIIGNPSMIKSVNKDKNREKFFENLDKLEFDVLVNKYTTKPSIIARVISKFKRIVKSVLRYDY